MQPGGSRCTHAIRCTWRSPPLLAWRLPARPWRRATKAPPQPPPNWNQTVTKESDAAGQEFDAKQIELIQKVTTYFNQMGDMKGNFVQISADNKRLRGKFYLKRPGQFRFEYNLPSKQIVDLRRKILGRSRILDLKTDDRWGLDQTPFRVLLRKDVDLLRDATHPGGRRDRGQDRSRAAGQEPRHAWAA